MDDLQKDIYRIWELRLKLEKTKKRSQLLLATLESEDFKAAHTEQECSKIRKQIIELIKEQAEIEGDQIKLEKKAGLPNPYFELTD